MQPNNNSIKDGREIIEQTYNFFFKNNIISKQSNTEVVVPLEISLQYINSKTWIQNRQGTEQTPP